MISGATVNGRKPLPGATVEPVGTTGGTGAAPLKAADVAGMGAKTTTTGQHIAKPGESTPPLNSPAASAERITTGTTAEEQRKKLAKKMYPSSNGAWGEPVSGI